MKDVGQYFVIPRGPNLLEYIPRRWTSGRPVDLADVLAIEVVEAVAIELVPIYVAPDDEGSLPPALQ